MTMWLNAFTNQITMYRLMLYYLLALVLSAVLFSWLGWLPFQPLAVLLSAGFIVAVCWLSNFTLAKLFKVVVNDESVYITSLILTLIITPGAVGHELEFMTLAGLASVLAMASKYLVVFRKQHLFNPATLGVALAALIVGQGATWWVGVGPMMPLVLLGGLLIVKKIQRFDLVISFFAVHITAVAMLGVLNFPDTLLTLWRMAAYSPIFFLSLVMLTEPLTTPPTRKLRMVYGALVGIFYAPNFHIGPWYLSPELALLAGNIFSYAVGYKEKLILQLTAKNKVAADVYDFVFRSPRPLKFKPGQYLEWTLATASPDSRGNRRYFTIASSPTEPELHLGVKFYPKPSSFKQSLVNLSVGSNVVAAQRAGDFTLPSNPQKKLAFIAGGIGITPFRSMVKYLLDTRQRRDVVLFYSAATPTDFAYQEIFDQAQTELGMKTVYTITDTHSANLAWRGRTGHLTAEIIKQAAPDYLDRIFYISGSRGMVEAFAKTLKQLGVKPWHIKKDFFPGYA